MIILDSDVIIHILDKKSEKKDKLLQRIKEENDEVVTTVLNLEEVLFGIFKSQNSANLSSKNLLYSLPIIPFIKEDSIIAAKIEWEMERKGKKKPRGDIIIASIAIRNNARLYTLNLKHFEDIPDLVLIK
ncbi:MAG: type II toxin-antitoxin system VapC family toxin [Candidatus Heimdallarchaeaceae archaeon]